MLFAARGHTVYRVSSAKAHDLRRFLRRHAKANGIDADVTVEPLVPLTPAQRRELYEQVERVGLILEGTPRLTIGTVTVGSRA